ncbi:isochorismate synthase [Spelaeicoccus albus]|nr:isochorismate synthase [Spelaeicoccus albus]
MTKQHLHARSYFIDGVGSAVSPFDSELPTDLTDFLTRLPASGLSAWVRGHSGLVGWGELSRFETKGADRFADASDFWKQLSAGADVDDAVRLPGSGPVAFGSFGFSDRTDIPSVLIVPRVVLGRHSGRVWVTTMSFDDEPAPERLGAPSPLERPRAVTVTAGGRDDWEETVGKVVDRIRAGEAKKVVMARDAAARSDEPLDVRFLLGHLNAHYPTCWTYHVDGMLGATPELLVSSHDGAVHSRVLAGTFYNNSGDHDVDVEAARHVLAKSKDSAEHKYAVDSLVETLSPLCSSLEVDCEPFLLELPNVIHLASDARGHLTHRSDGSRVSSLEIAAALHPTAAVGGTPRGRALELIDELEATDRGRYAGPVGWIGASGDGEWGLALRGGRLDEDGRGVRLFAGGGIVGESVPEYEWLETVAKLAPMLAALGVRTER